jgi:hypothetical protein
LVPLPTKNQYRRNRLTIIAVGLVLFPTIPKADERDGFIGLVTKSDKDKSGSQYTFANLRTSCPFVTYPSGNGAETNKVYEDKEIIVLIFVAVLTGSTETFYLNKKTKRFTLIEVGALEATVTGSDFRSNVTYGSLK